MPAPLADPLCEASPTDQIGCDGLALAFGNIPGHHLAVLYVNHQLEVQPDPAHGVGEIGDIPAPSLIRRSGPQTWNRPGLLWWPGSSAPVGLTVSKERLVVAAL
jgi:hypothetical protein